MTDPDVPWETLLASGDQPPRAEWARLVSELRNAAAELAGGKRHPMLPSGMVPIVRALIALNDYLRGSPAVRADPRLTAPLLQLIAAIYDMANGRAPPLFTPPPHASDRPENATL